MQGAGEVGTMAVDDMGRPRTHTQ